MQLELINRLINLKDYKNIKSYDFEFLYIEHKSFIIYLIFFLISNHLYIKGILLVIS